MRGADRVSAGCITRFCSRSLMMRYTYMLRGAGEGFECPFRKPPWEEKEKCPKPTDRYLPIALGDATTVHLGLETRLERVDEVIAAHRLVKTSCATIWRGVKIVIIPLFFFSVICGEVRSKWPGKVRKGARKIYALRRLIERRDSC